MKPKMLDAKVTDEYILAAVEIGHIVSAVGQYQSCAIGMIGPRYDVDVSPVGPALRRNIIGAATKNHVVALTWKDENISFTVSLGADAVRIFRMICRKIGPITRYEEL